MKQKLLSMMLLLFALIAGTSMSWAEDYTYTFTSKQFSSNSTVSLSGVSWTLAGDGGYWGYDGTKGQQFGSGNNPYKSLSLSTSGISGTITSIVVNASTGSSATATISCTVGGDAFGTQSQSLSATATNYTFSGSASGEIVVSMSQSTSKALYVKSITVTYTSGGSSLTASDLAITGAPVALSFDLYNNSSAQTVSYTTSSTGAITITPASPTSYFSYVHDAENKTITVTPIAVTPSAQTITISQEADETYEAGSKTFTVTVADSSPLANIAALTAKTVVGSYVVTLDDAVVTYVDGYYAYIQDASGAVAMYKNGHGLTAGDVLDGTATVTYQLRNNNPQITDLSGVTPTAGSAPSPTSVAQSAWNYTFSNVLSQYFEITGATITSSNNKYYVALNGDNVQLYRAGGSFTLADLSRTYTITGFPTLYNSTKELQIFADPEVEATTDPIITADNVNIAYDATSGEIAYTIENPTEATLTATLTEGNWISNVAVDAEHNKVTFDATANNGNTDRTATITLYYTGATNKVVTVTQAHYVADYATLPFSFTGGRADIENTTGLTYSGLGTDYGDVNAPLKFDSQGDNLILKINETPSTLTFKIKNNSFSGGTFTVEESADGSTYSTLKAYTTITGTQDEELTPASTTRYIRWIYTAKSSGNVGIGNINLAAYVAPVNHNLTVTLNDHIDAIYVFDTADDTNPLIPDGAANTVQVIGGTEIMVSPDVADGYQLATLMVDGNDVSDQIDGSGAYTFTMPGHDVTITATAVEYVAPASGDDYVLFSGDLVEGDYIIYYNGKAMNTEVSSDRLMYAEVTPENDVITTNNAAIVWHIAKSGDYWTIYNADADAYAAGTGVKNKAQMLADGTDDNALWTVSGNSTYDFVNKANEAASVNANLRNNGTYGFACYATSTGGALSLYKKEVATVSATIGSNGYATFACPYALDLTTANLPSGVTAYKAAVSGTTVNFSILNQTVPANTGILLAGAASTTYNIPVVASGDEVTGNDFLVNSTGATFTGDGNYYYFGLVKNTLTFGLFAPNEVAIPANKAYLKVLKSSLDAAGARELNVVFEDATGIESIQNSKSEIQNAVFDLSGRRVSKAVKGIYIVNGKKVVK